MEDEWLVELHGKLWGKKHLRDQIFRSVKVTEDDFCELQRQLEMANPDRNGNSYEAHNVLTIKLEFLQKLQSMPFSSHLLPPGDEYSELRSSFVSMNTSDPSSRLPASTSADIVNASTPLANPCSGSDGDDTMDIDDINPDSETGSDLVFLERILADFSNGIPIFPCTINYMDLSVLDLKNCHRLLPLTLIRDEWKSILDCVDDVHKSDKGLQGSFLITGQPGIGKYYSTITCHLI
jgi:hypothetical protein